MATQVELWFRDQRSCIVEIPIIPPSLYPATTDPYFRELEFLAALLQRDLAWFDELELASYTRLAEATRETNEAFYRWSQGRTATLNDLPQPVLENLLSTGAAALEQERNQTT